MPAHTHAIVASAMLAALVLPATVIAPRQSAIAQNIPSGPPAKSGKPGKAGDANAPGESKKDPATALKSLDAGVKAFEAGKTEQAVQSISSALYGGGLPSQQMARALYYRGLAYRKQSKPAQAISDLTSAIWLKGGLGDADRATAIENRAAAYREAGLGDPPPLAETVKSTAASLSTTAQAPKPSATTAPTWQTATSAGTAPAGPAAVAVPVPAQQADQSGNSQSGNAQSGNAQSAAAQSPGSGGIGSSVSNFFGGLFGGNSASAKSTAAPPTTASTGPAASTSSWSDATQVAASNKGSAASKPVSVATAAVATATADAPRQTLQRTAAVSAPVAATQPSQTPAVQPVLKGKFRLQVAAVRSRAEAETLAQKLRQGHGAAIGTREPMIEETVIGAMGTFYRVRVGPYADASEPRQLCSRIKPDGFDCLVVTQ